MNFGKPKNLSEMDFIDLDDNWALGKKDFSFRINGYSNHRHVSVPDKERFFDCPLLLKICTLVSRIFKISIIPAETKFFLNKQNW